MTREEIKEMITEYNPTYWNSKGKYQKEWDNLWKKLVPPEGEAETYHGEALRCMGRFYYDRYNNGNCNDTSYEKRFLNQYFRHEHLDIIKESNFKNKMDDELLDRMVDDLVMHVHQNESY